MSCICPKSKRKTILRLYRELPNLMYVNYRGKVFFKPILNLNFGCFLPLDIQPLIYSNSKI